MTGSNWSTLTSATATAFTCLVFASAAWHKLSDFSTFTGFVADYQVTPEAAVAGVSRAVVAAEVAVPLTLLAFPTRHAGALLAMAMLLGYAAAIALNILRDRRHINCGCGGAEQLLDWSLVLRNIALAGIAGLVLLSNWSEVSFVEAATAAAAGLTLWWAFLVVEQLLVNASLIRVIRMERV
jgi:hypothetical protein